MLIEEGWDLQHGKWTPASWGKHGGRGLLEGLDGTTVTDTSGVDSGSGDGEWILVPILSELAHTLLKADSPI